MLLLATACTLLLVMHAMLLSTLHCYGTVLATLPKACYHICTGVIIIDTGVIGPQQ